jgi:mycofactocin system glycosyltransferase
LPADWRVVLDPEVRRIDGGAVLVGGAPLRILRLTDAGSRLIDRLVAGDAVPQSDAAQRLVRRLLDAGIAHPRPGQSSRGRADVTVVIPVKDEPDKLARTLDLLDEDVASVIVVDDGSAGEDVGRVARARGATFLRHDHSRGPAAARNTGWRAAQTDLVAFVDAGCEPSKGWLETLIPHLDDPDVAAVAPRITTTVPPTLPAAVAGYEEAHPTLDRGPTEAIVRPRTRVPFVPTAALVVRRSALEQLDGFDERMRFGEDVDLVWRVNEAGWTVRYEPRTTVQHRARNSLKGWLRQRFDYGTSAAPLATRHGRAVAPLTVSPWSALAWGLTGLGAPAAGAAVGAGTTALLVRRLGGLEHPWKEAARLAGKGNLYAGVAVADAVRRAWWPCALVAAVTSRRACKGVVGAVAIPALLEWRKTRPPIDPLRWTVLRLVDDVAYGTGVWRGCIRERSAAALRPDLVSWPGRGRAVDVTVDVTVGVTGP